MTASISARPAHVAARRSADPRCDVAHWRLRRARYCSTCGARTRPSRPLALLAGALGLLSSGFLPWFDGTVSGFRLAGLIVAFGDVGLRLPPVWVGVVWFAVPVAGALTLVSLGWLSERRRKLVAGLPALLALGVSASVLVVSARAGGALSSGPTIATVSASLVLLASVARPGAATDTRGTPRPRSEELL